MLYIFWDKILINHIANNFNSNKMAKKKKTDNLTKKSIAKKTLVKKLTATKSDLLVEKDFWKKNAFPALFLLLFSFVIYIQSIKFDYVLDDKIVYHENGLVKKGWDGIAEIFGTESMVGYFGEQRDLVQGGRYRPLSLATFAIEQAFFGNHSFKIEEYWTKHFQKNVAFADKIERLKANPSIYEVKFLDEETFLNTLSSQIPKDIIDTHRAEILFHAGYSNSGISHFLNILFYGILVLILYRVLSMIFPAVQNQWYLTMAFVATLLFALHPVHTEVVANVKGRDEILALIGALGALYFTLKYIAEEKNIYLIFSGAIFLLGLLAKENVMTFMAVIPLTTYFFTKSSFQKNAFSLIPLGISFLIFLWMRKEAVDANHILDFGMGAPSTDLMNNSFVGMSTSEKYATIFYTLGAYVKLSFFPHPLTHDYYPYHIPIMTWKNLGSVISLLLYVGMGAYALWGLKKKSIISYGILFFLIPLSIVSNLVISVGTFMNERFLFFSSIGFCIIIAYWIARKLPAPILNIGLLAIFVVGFSLKTVSRVSDWENPYTLNSSGVKISPNSARANLFMCTSIFKTFFKRETDPNKKQEYLNESGAYLDRALAIHPRYGSALTMKVIVATEKFRTDRDIDRLLQSFERVVKIRKVDNSVDIYLNYFRSQGTWTNQLIDFCHRVGFEYFVKQLGDYPTGLKYINYGLSLDAGNVLLQQDAMEVRRLQGK